MRFSPRAGDATIFKKIASPSQAKNLSCSRGLSVVMEFSVYSSYTSVKFFLTFIKKLEYLLLVGLFLLKKKSRSKAQHKMFQLNR